MNHLAVELFHLARLHHARHHAVHQRLEGRIVLAEHERLVLGAQALAGDDEVLRAARVRDLTGQQDVVEHEGLRAAALHQQERIAVVLAREVGHFEAAAAVGLAQEAERRGAAGGGHRLALQVGNAPDARIGLHQHAHVVAKDVGRERHLLLALDQVGGGAALDVDRAVLHQRHAVGRSHGLVLDLDGRQLELGLHRLDDAVADLDAVAHGLQVAVQVREAERRLAVAEGDGAARLDLGERVALLRLRGSERQQGAGHHEGGGTEGNLQTKLGHGSAPRNGGLKKNGE
jgi:hypothetical protein